MKKKSAILFVLLALISIGLWSQTTIHYNDCSAATSGWTFYSGGGLAIQQGGYWLLDYTSDYILSEPFDVTSYSNLTLNFKVATYGSGTNHSCLVEYSTDGGSTWSSTTFTSATPTSSTYIDAGTWSLGTISTTQLVFRWTSPSGGAKGVRVDNITFAGTAAGASITVDPSSLSGFNYVYGSGPSGENSFSLTGNSLTANLDVSAASLDYEIASSSGGTFGSSLSYTPSGGSVSATVYVRLKSGLAAATYNGQDIVCSSTGATSMTVTCNGIVYKTEPTDHVTSFTSGTTTGSTVPLTWADAAKVTPDGYLIKGSDVGYSSIVDPTDGVTESWSTLVHTVSQGTQAYTFTGLSGSTTYYFKIYPYTNSGTAINYKTDGTVPQTSGTTQAQTILAPGDLAIIASQSDSPDQFAVILLTDLLADTVVYFTDNGWNDTGALNSSEGTIMWTVPAGGLPTGTIVIFNGDTWTVNYGSLTTSGSLNLSASGDQLLAYQGSSSSPTFIYALSTTPWVTTGTITSNTTYLPTGLTDGVSALDFSTEYDNQYYNVTPITGTQTQILASIANESNWYFDNTHITTIPDWQWGGFVPVELSSFTAVVTAQNYVALHWTTQSETNVAGYYIYRNTSENLNTATRINALITAANTSNETNYVFTDEEVQTGNTYYYWLQNLDFGGSFDFHGPISIILPVNGNDVPPLIPTVTELLDAYPNPFNPETRIRYTVKTAGDVKIDIYNNRGQIVRSFSQNHAKAGYFQIAWDGRDMNGRAVSSGIYYYRMTSGKYTSSKKVVLMK
jgi:hypothetical protein